MSQANANSVRVNLRGRLPRYLVSGVDANDFERVLPSVETWEDWRLAMSDLARERHDLGIEARDRDHRRTAADFLVGAAVYFHFAQLGYFEDESNKRATAALARSSHRLAFELMDPPVRQLRLPFRGVELVANVRVPSTDRPPPAVILLPGVDSTKEEMITFEDVFLRRGLATVAFEGPGQGETGEDLPLIEDYETAVGVLIDALENEEALDAARLGLYGRSMGGYLAPRIAALEPRIGAVTSAGGPFDLRGWPTYSEQLKRFFCHAWGLADLDAGAERAARVTLDGLVERIRCPFLIVHGDADRVFPGEEGRRMAAGATCETTVAVFPEGEHVCDNIAYKYRPLVADWFVDRLAT